MNGKALAYREANACIDYIHILVAISTKISVSSFVDFLKGKSSIIIFEKFVDLKYKYGNRLLILYFFLTFHMNLFSSD